MSSLSSSSSARAAHSPGLAAGPGCWRLASLELIAVQPACLQSPQGGEPGAPAAGQQTQHAVLLHLRATLSAAPGPEGISGDTSEQQQPQEQQQQVYLLPTGPALSPPLPLANAVLGVVVLGQHAQVLLQQQVDMWPLLQQQQLLSMRGQPGGSASRVAAVNVSLQFTMPATAQPLDVVHLLLTMHHQLRPRRPEQPGQQAQEQSPAHQAHEEQAPGQPEQQSELPEQQTPQQTQQQQQQQQQQSPPPPSGVSALIAEVPLLLMPPPAQQEVQQLLLPAMRQDVQAELQAQQQQVQAQAQTAAEDAVSLSLHVEHAAWAHYCQLAQDVTVILQLSREAAAAAAAGAGAGSGEQQQPPGAPVTEHAAAAISLGAADATAFAAAAAAGSLPPPRAALEHLASTLLFPLLLPFLAAHGLNNTLQLLLDCLPAELQQEWARQQSQRLQALVSVEVPAGADELQQQQGAAASSASSRSSFSEEAASLRTASSGSLEQQAGSGSPEAASAGSAAAAATESSSDGGGKPHKAAAAGEAAAAAAAAAAAGTAVPWHAPLTQFSGGLEQSYLAWKHHRLLFLDYLSALFVLLYMAALLRRCISQPSTLWYLGYIAIKAAPHMPLVFGMRAAFLRFGACPCGMHCCPGPLAGTPWHRERWLFLVAPVCGLLIAGGLWALPHEQLPALLPTKALRAYWSGRGELSTSVLRPFTQHMRLRPFAVYTLLDAAMSGYVLAQVFGGAAAARRWAAASVLSISLCWAFDLYCRRLFVTHQQRQQQQQQALAAAAAAAAQQQAAESSSSSKGGSGSSKGSVGGVQQALPAAHVTG